MSRLPNGPSAIVVLDEQTCAVRLGLDQSALIDRADASLVGGIRWHAFVCEGRTYAQSPGGRIYMHRLIAGTEPGYGTDHINGDGLDNRRANLRPATSSQNGANRRKSRGPGGRAYSSRFKGVIWDRARSRWTARIGLDRRDRFLGRFDDEADAARAYDRAALDAWGEFALLNFATEARS